MREGQVEVFEKIEGRWHTLGLYLMCPDKCMRLIENNKNLKIIDYYGNKYLEELK